MKKFVNFCFMAIMMTASCVSIAFAEENNKHDAPIQHEELAPGFDACIEKAGIGRLETSACVSEASDYWEEEYRVATEKFIKSCSAYEYGNKEDLLPVEECKAMVDNFSKSLDYMLDKSEPIIENKKMGTDWIYIHQSLLRVKMYKAITKQLFEHVPWKKKK